MCVFFKPRESKSPFVPCRFSVFLPSCLLHASRGQAWRPRARTNQSFPCRFSQSVVCVSLNPRASTDSSMPCRFNVLLPSCLPHAFRGQSWSPRASTIPSVLCWFSKSLVCFFLSLVQTRSHLCHVVFVSMCYSHLVCSTHLVDRTWRPRASTILSVPCRLVQ